MRSAILFLIAVILCFSCREKVSDYFGPFPKKPVINGYITNEGFVAVHVSWSAPVGLDTLRPINNAMVMISEDNVPLMLIDEAEKGWYVAEFEAKPGRFYTCRVSVPGEKEDIFASTRLPLMPQVSNIIHKTQAGRDADNIIYSSFKFSLQNNPSSKSYYKAAVFYRVGDTSEKPSRIVEMYDPLLIREGLNYPVFSNASMAVPQHTITINYSRETTNLIPGNALPSCLEVMAISEEYFNYLKSIEQYQNGLNPVFGLTGYQAAPVYSNTSNGLGIFCSYSVWRSNYIQP